VQLVLDLPIRTEPRRRYIGDEENEDYDLVSLWHGPRQLVFNQSLNNHLWKRLNARPALRSSYQTYGRLQLDKSFTGESLRIGDREYQKGLGTHSVSEIVYSLNGEFAEFRSDIGIDPGADGAGAVRFKVCVNGLVAHGDVVKASIGEDNRGQVQSLYGFEVSAMTGRDPARSISVKVKDAQVLRLVVDEAVNGLAKDYANWAAARLIRSDGSVVYLSELPDDRKSRLPVDQLVITTKPDSPLRARPDGTVALPGRLQGSGIHVHFNYLADLGYSLMKYRPVLHSWLRVEPTDSGISN
jgi:hypothetical protein